MTRLFFIFCISFPFLCGCGDVLKQPYPAKTYFGLDTGKPEIISVSSTTSATAPSNHYPALLIHPVRVVPPFDGISFLYQIGPAQYATDYYVDWIASPAALLTADLTNWLTASRCVIAVGPDSAVHPKYVLESTVTKLSINRTDPSHPVAELAAHFIMTREFADAAEVVFDTSDIAEAKAANNTSAAYAAAWGDAYRTILERFTAKLREAVKS